MDHADPGLPWWPDPEPQAPPRGPECASTRETWARTARPEVPVVEAAAVDEATARTGANRVTIGSSTDWVVEDPSRQDAWAGPAARTVDQLAWLIWPTDVLEGQPRARSLASRS